MNIDEYRRKYQSNNDFGPGWDAINQRVREIYPTQEPQHWAATPHASIGGPDPLDGISIYKAYDGGAKHLHFVTYGFSNLYYDEKSFGGEFSKFGFELTFRLRPRKGDSDRPPWVYNLMQNIARYVFKSKRWFEEYHFMPAGGPIKQGEETDITAIAFITDPQLGKIDTPHGEVRFLQMFGITTQEFERMKGNELQPEQLFADEAKRNPLFITDLERKS
jgi:Suppressor of fused protein (SUFU)